MSTLRCAVYTRVSTEAGLSQEFTSLDNQREAAEAYIKSQAGEGWRLLRDRYDDGGFSGGSTDRPALQRLIEQVRERRVDVIVVYKVDRLTRSLADFAKLVELFDAAGVSFVSVTQAFNTTTSMGRLTLNVLLSFAQFEREVTGERIRDKIAASKRRGIWMGGSLPLGYRVEERVLRAVADQAALIRMIFTRYLALGSVPALQTELHRGGIRVPIRTTGTNRSGGGGAFGRGQLYWILKNPIYAGQIEHAGELHPGQHEAIVDAVTWESVQATLAANIRTRHHRAAASEHLLIGRIRDWDGQVMTPSHAQKGTKRYRYYLAKPVQRGSAAPAPVRRISAPAIEAQVLTALRAAIADAPATSPELIEQHLTQVSVHPDRLELRLTDGTLIRHPWSPPSSRPAREIVLPPTRRSAIARPMKAEQRTRILQAIATARAWTDEITSGRIASLDALVAREGKTERSVRMTLSLASLSPGIVRLLIAGRLSRGIGIRDLVDLPASWSEQERALGM